MPLSAYLKRRDIMAASVVFEIALLTILGAWAFQIIGGYVPCELCLKERIPYYVGVPLALAAFMAAALKAPPTVTRTLLFLTALCFAVGVALGTYHAGAEWGWWAGPSDCGGGTGNTTSAGDLLGKLNNIHVIRCDQASWRLPNVPWGLSFAGWNAVISLVLVVIALWGGLARRLAGKA
jgi:disulfide bond formation protein DsbB